MKKYNLKGIVSFLIAITIITTALVVQNGMKLTNVNAEASKRLSEYCCAVYVEIPTNHEGKQGLQLNANGLKQLIVIQDVDSYTFGNIEPNVDGYIVTNGAVHTYPFNDIDVNVEEVERTNEKTKFKIEYCPTKSPLFKVYFNLMDDDLKQYLAELRNANRTDYMFESIYFGDNAYNGKEYSHKGILDYGLFPDYVKNSETDEEVFNGMHVGNLDDEKTNVGIDFKTGSSDYYYNAHTTHEGKDMFALTGETVVFENVPYSIYNAEIDDTETIINLNSTIEYIDENGNNVTDQFMDDEAKVVIKSPDGQVVYELSVGDMYFNNDGKFQWTFPRDLLEI